MGELIQIPLWGWLAFNIFIIMMITADLLFMHHQKTVMSIKQALGLSAMWIGMAFVFNLGIYYFYGHTAALNFLAGYLIEKALSVDNLFVFILIFGYFRVPKKYHHKVLFWGVLGAILMRALFIFFGISLVNHFHWILYFFGAFLIYAAIKMAMPRSDAIDPEHNIVIKWIKQWIPITANFEGDKFFTKIDNKWWATPLFIVVITLEMTDLIFAIDSIPAVMAITLDPFIIYTSNIFAILGLRALYFALAGLMPLFHYLKYGLSIILAFVGFKMLLEPFIDISIGMSLGFIVTSLTLTICASLFRPTIKPGP